MIDGDTIEIHGQRIRLFGIDAPESSQLCKDAGGKDYRCGQVAAPALADKIGREIVACLERDRDRYGRVVATCLGSGVDLGGWMVEHGYAVDFRRYSGGFYLNKEEQARTAKAGLWAGSFDWPWEWRRSQSR